MIKIEKLQKVYLDDDTETVALGGVSLEFENNKIYTILGKSGSGKSTLLNIIAGLEKPSGGSIFVEDKDISKMSNRELAKYRNKIIGYVFQSFYLETRMSVIDNVCLPLIIAGVGKKEREKKALDILEQLGMLSFKDKTVAKMSGGERQRVAIARALINDAPIILADEPTGNLDTVNGEIVMEMLKGVSKEGKTVIVVTHNREHAEKYSDVIVELKDGMVKSVNINEA